MARFYLPDLGEGLEEAQVVEWLVQVGETIQLNQPLCQVETAKALVDIPSPYAGEVRELHARPGDTVPVGAPLITIAVTGEVAQSSRSTGSSTTADEGRGPVLVGYGTEGPSQAFTRRRRGASAAPASVPAAQQASSSQSTQPAATAQRTTEVQATPLVRRMAAEKGIDLSSIIGSGPGGRIRVEDLEAAGARGTAAPPAEAVAAADEERISTIGLRKAIAARMVQAATTIPHFTEYALFDASAVVALRERLKVAPSYVTARLTFLPFFVRAVIEAARTYPILNSRWDEGGNAIVVKHSISVGVATDTARGLLVPVIRDAHTLTLAQIASECARLVERARDGKLDAKSLSGSTITVTNVGAAGPVDTGAPLINPPEASVVGFGAIKPRPMAIGDQVVVRPSCWISISCDHRIVDGATAARFMGTLISWLEEPERLV